MRPNTRARNVVSGPVRNQSAVPARTCFRQNVNARVQRPSVGMITHHPRLLPLPYFTVSFGVVFIPNAVSYANGETSAYPIWRRSRKFAPRSRRTLQRNVRTQHCKIFWQPGKHARFDNVCQNFTDVTVFFFSVHCIVCSVIGSN